MLALCINKTSILTHFENYIFKLYTNNTNILRKELKKKKKKKKKKNKRKKNKKKKKKNKKKKK